MVVVFAVTFFSSIWQSLSPGKQEITYLDIMIEEEEEFIFRTKTKHKDE